jgi:hypothetical protein
MTSFADVQTRPNKSNWTCWICRKQIHDMEFKPCCMIPKHLVGFTAHREKFILTTVCKSCSNKEKSYIED